VLSVSGESECACRSEPKLTVVAAGRVPIRARRSRVSARECARAQLAELTRLLRHTTEIAYVFATVSNYASNSVPTSCTWDADANSFSSYLVKQWTANAKSGVRVWVVSSRRPLTARARTQAPLDASWTRYDQSPQGFMAVT
jgi:hypothetical protein